MIVQNSRDRAASPFADAYEALLERYSPGRTRRHRELDIAAEPGETFPFTQRKVRRWEQALTVEEFVTMSSSSVRAQRAFASIGPAFFDRVRTLFAEHEEAGAGRVTIPYTCEVCYAVAAS